MFNYNLENVQPSLFVPQPEPLRRKEKTNSNPLRAFSKLYQLNKKYFLNIWGILFLITVFLNLYFLQPIDWNKFHSVFFQNKQKGNSALTGVIVFGSLFFLINDLFLAKWAFSIYIPKNKRLKEKISKIEWLKLLSVTFFIRSITPFSIGSEPYIIFWLKKRGVSLRQSSAIVSSLTISWFLAQGIITWPSFIALQMNHNLVSPTRVDSKYSWAIVIGLIVDVVSTLFVFTISYCQWVHYAFGLIKLKLNYFFKFKNVVVLSKAELKHKYLDNKSFQRDFKRVFFNVTTIRALLVFTAQNLLNYALYALLAIVIIDDQNFINSFHIINISTTSNNFLPTPGSEGSIQFTIEKMNSLVSPEVNGVTAKTSNSDNSNSLKGVIFLWRWFQKYKPFLCSVAFLVVYFVVVKCRLAIFNKRLKEINRYKNISPELASWYTVNAPLTLP
ncbi:hypothetical protein DNK47_00725 [Mycoplasma wenyonii]|uniref:Uncharacterized protein n=1 Tax=Mycoplasma wenyonii TaxID=65123 RepID=A0A328PW48_9MOLU|nr:lysylphosphatidylglycerol synthase domain-containing protein [Mycoplasma wenyonii]RAO95359.1 hypothetical protein DNK47_00725 [Mycoplasma wenyonii]